MARVASIVTNELAKRLSSEEGLGFAIGMVSDREKVSLAPIAAGQILTQNISSDMIEKTQSVKYPLVYVFCDRVVNTLKEKFRTFSGTASLNVEIRVSHEHVDALSRQLQLYVDAATQVLDQSRGSWSGGMFYTGGYEVIFNPVKPGGKQFIQSARVRFDVHLSSD
jgi:hypothetical protein